MDAPPLPEPPYPVWGTHGIAACDHEVAARAALEVMQQGGNAVDGAVALSTTLGVVCPNYTGLGGGGFMLVWMPGMPAPEVLDYRETAPNRAYTGIFATRSSQASTRGALAVAVPGLVAGLAEALSREAPGRLVLVAAQSPYDLALLPASGVRLATYGETPAGLEALGRALFTAFRPSGRCPVTVNAPATGMLRPR